MKKIIALILVVALLCPMVACAAEEKQNEIYVMYKDGSDGILSYSSEAEAQNAIAELSEDENIILAAPNYIYETNALLTSDEYISRQWALSNDGTFFMEESKNEHPVFDTPFGSPKQPGQWKRPRNGGGRGFRGYATENSGGAAGNSSVLSVTISEGESRQRTRRSGRGQMPFGGGFTEAEEELIRELTDRMLREFFR